MNSITLAKWNDEMVEKYHKDGTIFESRNPILRYIEKNRVSKILEFASHPGESTILDLGCGEGYLLSLIPNAQDVVGFDISNRALGKAKEYLKSRPQINLLCGDGQILCFKDNSFDIVICSEMIERVPDPKRVIKEIHRVLKPNGILVVSIPDEMRIKKIMRIMCYLKLDKVLPGIRKHEAYEWHLQEADVNFLDSISNRFFTITKIVRTPTIVGYRYVVKLQPREIEVNAVG